MFEYRVTKYNPAFRDANGCYMLDEWTSFGEIGDSFAGVVLTAEQYQRVEDSYIASALRFLHDSGQTSLTVEGLEEHRGKSEFREGQAINTNQLGRIIRRILRNEFWCRIVGQGCFLHFGYDYYLYVGVPHECPESIELAQNLGLFVESFPSPYHKDEYLPPETV